MAAKRVRRTDYRLPPGPRGDAPGGRRDQSSSYTRQQMTRKFPNAPHGRYPNGFPIPSENLDAPIGRKIPRARPRGDFDPNGTQIPNDSPSTRYTRRERYRS